MKRLGYIRFVAQGGDWGDAVTGQMAVQAPPELAGVHTNMPGAVPDEIEKALQAHKPAPAGLSADEQRACGQLVFVWRSVRCADRLLRPALIASTGPMPKDAISTLNHYEACPRPSEPLVLWYNTARCLAPDREKGNEIKAPDSADFVFWPSGQLTRRGGKKQDGARSRHCMRMSLYTGGFDCAAMAAPAKRQ